MSDPISDIDDSPYPAPAKKRGPGVVRHLVSVVVSLITVPLAYLALDRAGMVHQRWLASTMSEGNVPAESLLWFGVGGGLLFIAAAAGRLGAIGPLLAALVWGVAPALVAILRPRRLFDVTDHLDWMYDRAGFWLVSVGSVLFVSVAALLLGTAISGQWRRTPVNSPTR